MLPQIIPGKMASQISGVPTALCTSKGIAIITKKLARKPVAMPASPHLNFKNTNLAMCVIDRVEMKA